MPIARHPWLRGHNMALSDTSLSTAIKAELTAAGLDVSNPHAKIGVIADAIAKAVVAEITANASVTIASGSSAGSYGVS